MTSRTLLATDRIRPAALRQITSFHADTVSEVSAAVTRDAVVVVGMAQNPHVKNVRKALASAGIDCTYLEYGSYLSKWRQRLAIKMWSGWPTFPQVYVKGTLIGGFSETTKELADGSLKKRLG